METGELLGILILILLVGLFAYPLMRTTRCPACGRLGAIRVTENNWRIEPSTHVEGGDAIEAAAAAAEVLLTDHPTGGRYRERAVLRERAFRCRHCDFHSVARERITTTQSVSHLPVIREDDI